LAAENVVLRLFSFNSIVDLLSILPVATLFLPGGQMVANEWALVRLIRAVRILRLRRLLEVPTRVGTPGSTYGSTPIGTHNSTRAFDALISAHSLEISRTLLWNPSSA
jgi:hypothetical protein